MPSPGMTAMSWTTSFMASHPPASGRPAGERGRGVRAGAGGRARGRVVARAPRGAARGGRGAHEELVGALRDLYAYSYRADPDCSPPSTAERLPLVRRRRRGAPCCRRGCGARCRSAPRKAERASWALTRPTVCRIIRHTVARVRERAARAGADRPDLCNATCTPCAARARPWPPRRVYTHQVMPIPAFRPLPRVRRRIALLLAAAAAASVATAPPAHADCPGAEPACPYTGAGQIGQRGAGVLRFP